MAQTTRSLTLADALIPRIGGDNRLLMVAREAGLLLAFAGFVAVFAQIQVRLPWTTVPITGQTFAVLVTGASLGAWRGAGALTLYAVAGMFLLPVFTPAAATTSGAWDVHFILPWQGNERVIWELANGGYIVGFV